MTARIRIIARRLSPMDPGNIRRMNGTTTIMPKSTAKVPAAAPTGEEVREEINIAIDIIAAPTSKFPIQFEKNIP